MKGPAAMGLAVTGLDVDLARRPVLRGVDLRVAPGELVGLLGPNGAGKTTLQRAVLGLVRPLRGTVAVDGARVRLGRSAIGYVPQRHEFTWDFPVSVEQAVLSGRIGLRGAFHRPKEADYRAVNEALARVQLRDLRQRPVGELSGGQRQRVLVARALAVAPSVLLLDEPFTGLDMPTQDLLTQLIVDLAAEGRAVLMATHDLLGALTSCTRVALLSGGIVADGRPSDLRDPDAWMRTFGIGEDHPMLRLVSVAT